MPRMDKLQRAEYDRAYRERVGVARKAKQAEWRAENAEHLKVRNTNRRIKKRAMCLVAAARVRARKRGIPFEVSESDIAMLQSVIDDGACQVTGAAFTLNGPRCATSPSLDRINPSLGYVGGNLRVVCHAINAGMGDWGESELLRIVRVWMAKVDGNAISAPAATAFIESYCEARDIESLRNVA